MAHIRVSCVENWYLLGKIGYGHEDPLGQLSVVWLVFLGGRCILFRVTKIGHTCQETKNKIPV